ncbi:type I 3-dehydroquinate dehydratase [Sporolactobacillus sp. THM7-4]|nr:type I 3-dehydroquinate dehydratase [Sporolactobacillus sp. THM7-4]
MRTVKVKSIEFGRGIPKVAVPMVGRDIEGLRREISEIHKVPFDLVEWRIDFFNSEDPDELKKAAAVIRSLFPDKPIISTFRTAEEGGEKTIGTTDYLTLNSELIKSGQVDLVDVELFRGDETVQSMVQTAHERGVRVIASNHDFQGTPSLETMISRLKKMQTLNADLTKIAVMPKSISDVLTLLKVTEMMKTTVADRPFITMSMSKMGMISRLTGELFGSAVTFGSAARTSAPGQIEAVKLAEWLEFFHRYLS